MEGDVEGDVEGEGDVESEGDGDVEGDDEGEGDGDVEGEAEGDGDADDDADGDAEADGDEPADEEDDADTDGGPETGADGLRNEDTRGPRSVDGVTWAACPECACRAGTEPPGPAVELGISGACDVASGSATTVPACGLA